MEKTGILIVDDDISSIYMQTSILRQYLIEIIVYEASNADHAIEIFKNNKNIKLVLLDMMMPIKSGTELFLILKNIRKDFKAIAVSEYDSKYGFNCGRLGFEDFIRKPLDPSDFIKSIEFQIKSINNGIKGKVFCIMPFTDTLYDTYIFGIKQTLNNLGYYCFRIDEEIYNDSIIEKIKDSIVKADFIIADLTYSNPNVYYEIGYAHALNKKVILIASSVNDMKFDLKHMRALIYNEKISELKEKLEKEFRNKYQPLEVHSIKNLDFD